MKQYLEIAKFTKTHGLKGDLRAQYFCRDSDEINDFETLYLGRDKTPVTIEKCRESKNVALIKLRGVDGFEAAQRYIGKVLYVDRNDMELPDDTWFIQDVIGLEVIDVDTGEIYGKVDDVLQNCSTDVYSVKSAGGGQLLFPSIPDVLIETNIEAGYIKIRPLEGLFDG